MGVPALGDALPTLGRLGERVAFHDSDALMGVGQHSGGEEPGQARPEGDCFAVGRLGVVVQEHPRRSVARSTEVVSFRTNCSYVRIRPGSSPVGSV